MLALVDLPDWTNDIAPVDGNTEGYERWWSEVSVNCWRQRDDELFATIFEELRYPYDADTELLARFPEDEARPPPPEPAPRPARAPRPIQAGIVIREPPQEGSVPPSGSRTVNASPATGQAAKKKAIVMEPEVEDSSSDDDDPQTVRRRSSRQVGEGSSVAGENASASHAQAPTGSNNPPPPISATNNMQLALVPVQVIDDSSPEVEERIPLPDTPREPPTAVLTMEQVAPDSVPVSGEVDQEPMPIAILHEPPILENPAPIEEVAAATVEVLGENPAEPDGADADNQESVPDAPQVPEVGDGVNPEPVLEAVPVTESRGSCCCYPKSATCASFQTGKASSRS
ncbi:uncharacterized protein LOC133723197 [Rosa rugosa]|uniref:uncharacterized protein LOC133723197 n=1 Tax=Rosa rugosa TaxID=74645 RepID=UPI002B403539|nr:uncharacterized protein LOC133723197 [Rosa rugosa]